jgi:hypothetical protein
MNTDREEMTTIRRAHQRPYRERSDLRRRVESLRRVIEFLRDCDLAEDSKKRMLNHAVWEITAALGNLCLSFAAGALLNAR